MSIHANAQDCSFSIQGKVFDEAPKNPLGYVNVFIQEIAKGVTTDDDGGFKFDNICKGHYHITFSHIGCEGKKIHLDLVSDTTILVMLPHTPTSLEEVVVKGKKEAFINQPNLSINRKDIEENTNQNLSGLLENETGVHLIKNGSGISKPVVQGLYGNRLMILNNGIPQSGQQWGNDHSPEIDPFSADKIAVLKGASAIEYGSGNLGNVVLVEPKPVEKEPHLHGQVNYAFETNGRGQTINTRLEKYSSTLGWRFNATYKKYGDRKAANYFLNNTGNKELNFSLQMDKAIKEKLFINFYASTFNTTLGILRGSHIGNLTDLNQALENEVPFFTEPNFNNNIEAPSQKVGHHLAKLKTKYFFRDDRILEFVVAGQLNDRKEFDVRRSGRTEIPTLSLAQITVNTELKYIAYLKNNWKLKIGNQNVITDNTNNPETEIKPLIPDYFSWKSGLFSTISNSINKTDINLGLRYDFELQNVVTLTNTVPIEIKRFKNKFHNFSGLATFKYKITNTQFLSWNSGFAMRNPGINELYSNGLHQGVSGIEEGEVNLKTEKAFKNTLEYKWSPSANFSFNSLVYYQYFNDYIYLNPQDEVRLTIRGAFPVFKYEATDAAIFGLDISTQFTLGKTLFSQLNYSFIKGKDITNSTALLYIPPNSFFGSLTYRLGKTVNLSNKIQIEDTEFEINNRYVLNQGDIQTGQDFVLPPPAYNLFGLKFSTNLMVSNQKIRFFVKADNLFNVQYRDYLNRQRYFADDLGLSVTLGIIYKF